jgi:hypothetical protein
MLDEYLPKLSCTEKGILLKAQPNARKAEKPLENGFAPTISLKSARIATEKRRKRGRSEHQDLGEFLMSEGKKSSRARQAKAEQD